MKNRIIFVTLLIAILTGCKTEEPEIITPTSPIASFDYKISSADARRVQFINKSSGDLYNFFWEFGDGDTSDEKNPDKLYWKNGKYKVRMMAWGSNSQQKFVCEKTITIKSNEPSLMSNIYIKGLKLYSIPSDGRYYKFTIKGTCSLYPEMNFTINTRYTDKLYSSDLPKTFLLESPQILTSLLNMIEYDEITVFVYQSTSASGNGTQCLKQIFFQGGEVDSFTYRDEYIVASNNGQTRVGVVMGWSDD